MDNSVNKVKGNSAYVAKNVLSGAIQGTVYATGFTLYDLHKNKQAKSIIESARDSFESSNVVRQVSSDSIQKIDTYTVNGAKNIRLHAPLGTKMNYENAIKLVDNNTKAIKKGMPKYLLKSAGFCAALLGGISLLRCGIKAFSENKQK
ncbi:MAG: hypothetical protein LUE64_01785 [Candidatus Gastranaerophilales bacterium]|nr:hypothetical protein [Candidatus Gastranaerophilales bacterium]